MKHFLVGFLLSVASLSANAGIISIDTSNWLKMVGPSNDRNTDQWVGLKSQKPEKKGNSSGTLVSDFELFGDFLFTGFVMPTTVNYDDNDIIGLVFGWQDAQNHYRLGWSQTQRPNTDDDKAIADITGKTGMFLIREVGGVSDTLFNISDLFWQDDVSYNFNISRSNNQIDINFGGTTFSIEDSTFNTGHIGVYTESQTARFWGLTAETPDRTKTTLAVSEPGALVFLSGLVFVVATSRRNRKKDELQKS